MENPIIGRWVRSEALDAAKTALVDAGRQIMATLKTIENQEVYEVARAQQAESHEPELQLRPEVKPEQSKIVAKVAQAPQQAPRPRTTFPQFEKHVCDVYGRKVWNEALAAVRPNERRQVLTIKKALGHILEKAKSASKDEAPAAAGKYDDLRESLDGQASAHEASQA